MICEIIFFSERLMTLHESLMRNGVSSTPSPGLSAEQFCNQRAQWPSSPIDDDYRAGEMHPVSTLRVANDGGESNCESDGGRGTLDSPSNGIWIHGIQISSTILCYVNEQTITLGMWSPWQHPTYGHFTWKWETWSQSRCFKSSPSQDTVVIIVLCASLTPSTPERTSAPLADVVTCLLWPLMDL